MLYLLKAERYGFVDLDGFPGISMLDVRFLGQFEVLRDGQRLTIPTRNAQALFAYLILNAGKSYRRERLAGLLWPDSSEDNARSNLRHELWRLRKVLEPGSDTFFRIDDLSIAFNPQSEYSLDTHILERMPLESSSADELILALSAYSGELLPGFYEEWVFSERNRLQALFEAKVARLLDVLQSEARWSDILEWGTHWIGQGGWPEPAYRALMFAYANTGDVAKAILTYERLVQGLQKDMGIKPSEPTQALYKRIRTGVKLVAPIFPVAAPSPAPTSSATPIVTSAPGLRPSNLPRPLTSFIGRDREIQEVSHLVLQSRLVTLLGPGGVGKTRLAIQVADCLAPSFKDGAWWIELAAVFESTPSQRRDTQDSDREPGEQGGVALVAQTIAKSLRIPESTTAPVQEAVVDYLRDRHLLLVLDNCEHLIEACAILAERVLSGCPDVTILATSREAMEIPGEKVWHLYPLSLPEVGRSVDFQPTQQSEAVKLFLERAGDVIPGYHPGILDEPVIAQICVLLDGIPLAIELAAARMNLLSAQEIATRLDRRFSLLTDGRRTALPRHQTLLAALEWSYNLLSEPEQVLFRRLSIFAGGFTLDSAESICSRGLIQPDQILTLVGRLVVKSLVNVKHTAQGPGSRTHYHLLNTICSFGRLKLDEAGETSWAYNQHADYFVNLVEEGELELRGSNQMEWINRLREEQDDLRAAFQWLLDIQDAERALRIAGSLWRYWWMQSLHNEGREWLGDALSIPASQPPALRAKALNGAGVLARGQGDLESAGALLDECLAIERSLDDKNGLANVLNNLGILAHIQGEYTRAISYYEEGINTWIAASDSRGEAVVLHNLSMIYQEKREFDQAEELLNRSLSLFEKIGDLRNIAATRMNLGYIMYESGDVRQSEDYFRKSLLPLKDLGVRNDIIECLEGFAGVAAVLEQPRRGARLLGVARAQREVIGIPVARYHQVRYQQIVESVKKQLDAQELEEISMQARGMSLDDAIDYALAGTE